MIIRELGGGLFIVAGRFVNHVVSVDGQSCSCPAWHYSKGVSKSCKHLDFMNKYGRVYDGEKFSAEIVALHSRRDL